jgi:integrase
MNTNSIRSFTAITLTVAARYAEYVTSLGLATNTQLKRLSVLEMLYQFTGYYQDGVQQDPWPESSSTGMSGDTKSSGKQTDVIPDSIFQKLGTKSLEFIEKSSDAIVKAYDECNDVIRGHRPSAVELFNSGEGAWVNEEYEFKIQYAATRATPKKLNAIAKKYGFSTYGDIGKSVRRLQTAGYIVCAMFSGLRDSELGSLQIGCHQVKESLDGEVADWLYGRTFKLEESSKEVRWLVPPCVGKAVAVLEQISSYHRECLLHQLNYLQSMPSTELSNRQIHELKLWANSLFLTKANSNGYTYKSLDNETTNKRLQKFMSEEKITDTDGRVWQLRSHQFRRTFAVFVAKNLIGDLRYLRHHFKHWSMDMTLHYARHDRGDESLISEIMNERDQITRIIVSDWLTDDKPLLGGRGKSITAFKKRHDVKTEEGLKSSLGAIADGLFIRATGHSWCMSNAESCGGEGLYDQIQCVSCDNAVIDQTLIPAWEGIKEQELEILELDDVGAPVKFHAAKTIAKANEVIEMLTNGH